MIIFGKKPVYLLLIVSIVRKFIFRFLIFLTIFSPSGVLAVEVRIKDLVDIVGVRGNDLVGYGLVVGLDGTGDGLRNSPFTEEAMTSLLERLGVNVMGEQLRPKNVAAVLVTAVLPPFARNGNQIDVTVSAIGDSKSLLGGTLIMTPLNAADGQIYAVAQGSIISGGVVVEAQADKKTQGVPTSGSIPSGARVERELQFVLDDHADLTLALREPDFTTANRIEIAINKALGNGIAKMIDAGTIRVHGDLNLFTSIAHQISAIENVEVSPSQSARVVVDHRSGTIVLGTDVRISKVAIAQGNLTLTVEEQPSVVSANPFFPELNAISVPRSQAEINADDIVGGLALFDGSIALRDIVNGLNALGVGPRDMIDILKSIKAAGALHAEFIVQ